MEVLLKISSGLRMATFSKNVEGSADLQLPTGERRFSLRRSIRSKSLTEKGSAYRKERLIAHLKTSMLSWMRQAVALEKLLVKGGDLMMLKAALDQLETTMKTVLKTMEDLTHEDHGEISEQQIQYRLRVEELETDHSLLFHRVSTRIRALEALNEVKPLEEVKSQPVEPRSVVSSTAGSQSSLGSGKVGSRRSTTSSLSDRKAKVAADAAAIKVKIARQQQELTQERILAEAKAELERMKLTTELEATKAKLKAVDEVVQGMSRSPNVSSEQADLDVDGQSSNLGSEQHMSHQGLTRQPGVRFSEPLRASTPKKKSTVEIEEPPVAAQSPSISIQQQGALIDMMKLPTPEPGVFSGDPLVYNR